MSTNRIIVDARLHDAFVERFVTQVRGLKTGDPNDIATAIGPIVNASQLHGLLDKIAQARTDGAHMALGGEPNGQVLPPHVFTDVSPDSALARDESFGPIVPILRAKDEADALTLANASEYGLSSAVFAGDLERGVRFAQRIDAGMTHVNDASVGDEPHMAFGGEKNSGMGRFGGEWVIRRVHLGPLDLGAAHAAWLCLLNTTALKSALIDDPEFGNEYGGSGAAATKG